MSSTKHRNAHKKFWPLTIIAVIVFILVQFNIILSMSNNSLREKVVLRQEQINKGIQLSRLNTQLIQGLALTASQTGDQDIKRILSEQGINFSLKANQKLSKP